MGQLISPRGDFHETTYCQFGHHGSAVEQEVGDVRVARSIGGLIGIIVGVVGSKAISAVKHWPSLISPSSIIVAFLFSAAVGIFFGFYPARKAAQLDPIEALRYE